MKLRYTLLLAGSLFSAAPGFAAETPDPINQRISRLEAEIAELKALIKSSPAAAPAPAAPTVSTASGTKLQLYGFARFDASYDSGQIYPGNIALYARPRSGGKSDGEWNLTAGATRLGLNLSGPDTPNMKLTGNIEMDFLGGGTENNSNPRLRHGYLKAYWPASDLSLVAGQTWDLVAPQMPFVDDAGLMWDAGNIGSRHPQLRLTKGVPAGERGRMELAIAASRTIGETNATTGITATDPGKDAAMPTIQGRVAWSGPVLVGSQPATIGISGHYGQEEWDSNNTGSHKTLDSWSCAVDLLLPVCNKLTLAGEYFTGTNLDDYFGGAGQGVNAATIASPKAIRAHGGWAALKVTVNADTAISLGAGIDDPNDSDLSAPTARTKNQSIFGMLTNKISSNMTLGIQLGQWRTNYLNNDEGNALRAQSSLTYKF
ncbi:MAG: hypothetical protein WCH05_01710 [Chlorobiaceae bacterium]